MGLILKTIFGLAIVQGVFGNAPKMLWADCPDDDACDKCLEVAFESGNDIACLNEKFPETECILEGNFMNGGARVFVSSEQCINGGDTDHIQVSFTDSRCPGMAMFEVDAESGFSTSEVKMPVGTVDTVKWPEISGDQEESKGREDRAFPANGFTLKLAIRYDTLFATAFPGIEEIKIQAVMGHVQTLFQWNSLDAKMCLDIMSIKKFNGSITTNNLTDLGPIVDMDPEDPNLFVFITHLTPPSGGGSFTVGIAWGGTVCTPDSDNVNGGTDNGKGFRISINSWVTSDLGLSETIAHEMGHNLNMEHDFDPFPGDERICTTNGSSCTNIGGVMDYFGTPNKWTCCSNADFKELYDAGQADCLTECTDTPTTTPTPTGPTDPTTTSPGACGAPQHYQDKYCDDQNNNPGCNFDGGDCCPPYEDVNGGWDQFCESCECLETSACGGPLAGPEGVVQSPGFPAGTPFKPNWNCEWLIDCGGGESAISYTRKIYFSGIQVLEDSVTLQVTTPQNSACPDNDVKMPMIVGNGCVDLGDMVFRRDGSINGTINPINPLAKSVAYEITYKCSNSINPTVDPTVDPTTTATTTTTTTKDEICEDEWPQKKCKKCNGKKCQKGSCVKKCKNTCNLCEDVEECEDKWPEKKCKKCNKKKCKSDKNCKKNCQKTCDLCDDRILAFDPFY